MKILYKWSVLLPMALILFVFFEPFTLCVPGIGLYLERGVSEFFVVMIICLWLCCSPFRKSCCNGTVTELLFNLVPVEFILLMIFAQWHFVIAIIITLLLIGGETFIFINLRRDEQKHRITKRRHQKYKAAFQRLSVFTVTAVLFIPCLMASLIYGLQSPTYKADVELWERILEETDLLYDNQGIMTDDLYLINSDLWGCFEENRWDEMSIKEKITVVQKLVDFESNALGVPTVPVNAALIGAFTLGAYDSETNEMWINTEHLANSTVEECIRTVCHETFHSSQYYIVSTLDWDSPATKTAYFDELREWQFNEENYKNAQEYGFSAYENQPLEVAAREYAEKESAKIMHYVKNVYG